MLARADQGSTELLKVFQIEPTAIEAKQVKRKGFSELTCRREMPTIFHYFSEGGGILSRYFIADPLAERPYLSLFHGGMGRLDFLIVFQVGRLSGYHAGRCFLRCIITGHDCLGPLAAPS